MRLAVLNGSPRGDASSTAVLLREFTNGFTSVAGNSFEQANLIRSGEEERFRRMFAESEDVLLAFPLYCDCMPACVKAFIESLQEFGGRVNGRKAIGFIVHSGFPEAMQSRAVERYLEKLARRFGCRYLGTVIKGGTEGVRLMPPQMTRKLRTRFRELGRVFGETGAFDPGVVKALARPERLSRMSLTVSGIMSRLGVAAFHWNQMLRQNGAFERRFAAPYEETQA